MTPISPDLQGKIIQTVCSVYGGYQKDQVANLHKIPKGTIGTVRAVKVTSDDSYILCRFVYDKRVHWAKLGPTTFELKV